jgi:ornithine carbamoyltransferase
MYSVTFEEKMAYNLRNRNFLKLLDFTSEEIRFLLDLSQDLKKAKYSGTEQPRLKGKNIAGGTGAKINITDDIETNVKGCDFSMARLTAVLIL